MSLPSPDVPWSRQQREWLRALGHDVLVLARPSSSADGPGDPDPDAAAPSAPPRGQQRPATDGPGGPVAVPDSLLLRALARAAGRPPHDAEFLAILPDPSALRGSPAARRALWPRLRALRKRSRS